jgi:hypothetical protein
MWHEWEGGETCTGFLWESPKEKDHFEDQGVDGRMGSKWTLGRLVGGAEWIHLAQDRDRFRAVVNAVITFGFWHHRVSQSPISQAVCPVHDFQ